MLDPLLLRSFVAIIDTGSFTRAGEELGMSQAAVSYQIRLLEERLGFPLFLRQARQVGDGNARQTIDVVDAVELEGIDHEMKTIGHRGLCSVGFDGRQDCRHDTLHDSIATARLW